MATATGTPVAARPEVVVFYHLPNGEHIPGQEVHLHSAETETRPEWGNSILIVFHDEAEFHHAQSVMGLAAFRPIPGGPWQAWLHRSQVAVPSEDRSLRINSRRPKRRHK